MRVHIALLSTLTVLAAGCDSSEHAQHHISGPGAVFARGVPDLDGTPDLVVDQHVLSKSWVVYEEELKAGTCQVIEGGFAPGVHRTLRFTVTTPNIGTADLVVGNPLDHIDPNGDGDFSDSNGLFEYAPCHNHFHFRNYATYEIIPVGPGGELGTAVQAKKRGFCMMDSRPWNSPSGPPRAPVYQSCGTIGTPGNQGISTGWADEYYKWLSGQFFLLTDPDEPVPPGEYLIRVHVNPPFEAEAGEPCPVVDSAGLCHMFEELDYTNNIAEVRITVPTGVGKKGHGPGGGGGPPNREYIDDERKPLG